MGSINGGRRDRLGSVSAPHRRGSEAELFTILSNERRRYVLETLITAGERRTVGALAERLAAYEDGVSIGEITSADRKRVYTALQQSQLPKLDAIGVIDFHSNRGTVEPTPALETVELYMDIVHGNEISWSEYYLGMTGVAAVILGGSAMDLVPFTLAPSSAWTAVVIVMFAVSTLAHRYYDRQRRITIEPELSRSEADSSSPSQSSASER